MPPDTISLVGITLYGYHGVRPEERALGQRFVVDLELESDLRRAGETDTLDATVNYSEAYELVAEIIEGEPVNLLETLAERIARAMFEQFSLVQRSRVRIAKPGVAISGSILREAAVTIDRERTDKHG
ncbi:MAG: dihydroneopterin aldolase [Chloroflexota bacterium]|nr:dihydroneopterin aldolase [Chloroflexota bacterium]MDE2897746.1 dihydroneopterin aldolase [Chloroflexota bacterium]